MHHKELNLKWNLIQDTENLFKVLVSLFLQKFQFHSCQYKVKILTKLIHITQAKIKEDLIILVRI